LAFVNCSNLTSVAIPNSVTNIGDYAFQSSGLTYAIIPNNVEDIGIQAFSDCSNMTKLTIGTGVKRIQHAAFAHCTGLANITIPDSVTEIYSAFSSCNGLTNATIPDNVRCISYAFSQCRGLITATIGSGVTNMEGAFNTSGLKSVTIKDGVSEIGKSAFSDCSGLTNVVIPDSVNLIEERAFYSCDSLTNMPIGKGVTSIGRRAFSVCNRLTNATIPDSVTSIGDSAFEKCNKLKKVSFKGAPPLVGTSVFYDVAPGARGYYTAEHSEKWEAVIDENGKWEGLIMGQVPGAELRVESANPAAGSLTLAWEDALAGEGMTYSIYRGEGNSRASAVCVKNGVTGTNWTDPDYWESEPVGKPLNYWVVADGDGFGERESNPVETRHCYGLCVGYDAYGVGSTPLKQSLADATLCKTLAEKAGFTVNLLENGAATAQGIHDNLIELAGKAGPGDTVFFYIATHGGVSPSKNNAALIAYDESYGTTNLASDVAAFDPGVGFIGIIMACRSSAMADPSGLSVGGVEWIPAYTSPASGAANWLLEHGLAECKANVAWVTSCGADEKSPVIAGLDGTQFGEWFLRQGWQNGYADRRLRGMGYEGGNRDGTNTVLELARYAEAFACGRSDVRPAHVSIQNEALLGKTIVATGVSSCSMDVPATPTGLHATQGTRDWSVGLEWDASPGATAYRVYRGDECIAYQNTGTSFDDTGCNAQMTYSYRVRALNAAGLGGASDPVPGWRKGKGADDETWEFEIADGTATIAGVASATGAVVIPSEADGIPVTEIGTAAFAGCAGLTSVTIPASVTNVGANAFAGCTGLTTLYLPETKEGTDMLANAGVPEGCAVVYGNEFAKGNGTVILSGDFIGSGSVNMIEAGGNSWYSEHFITNDVSSPVSFTLSRVDEEGTVVKIWSAATIVTNNTTISGTLVESTGPNPIPVCARASSGRYLLHFNERTGEFVFTRRYDAKTALFANPGLEETTTNEYGAVTADGWEVWSSNANAVTVDSADGFPVHSGTKAVLLRRPYADWEDYAGISQCIGVAQYAENGLALAVSAYCRKLGEISFSTTDVMVQMLDSSWSLMVDFAKTSVRELSTTSWTHLSCVVPVPSNAAFARISYRLRGISSCNGGGILIDDLEAKPAGTQTQNFNAWGNLSVFARRTLDWYASCAKTTNNLLPEVDASGDSFVPSGYSCILQTNSFLMTSELANGVGMAGFHALCDPPDQSVDVILQTSSSRDAGLVPERATWSSVATNTVLPGNKWQFFANDISSASARFVRFISANGSSLQARLRIDDVSLDNYSAPRRWQDFEEWNCTGQGAWTKAGWSIVNGSISTSGGGNFSRCARLADGTSTLSSPFFEGGVGDVSFYAKVDSSYGEATATLKILVSSDRGETWIDTGSRATVGTAGTNLTLYAYCGSNAAIRIACEDETSDVPVLIDNVWIERGIFHPDQDFEDWTAKSYGTHTHQGWQMTDCLVNATNGVDGSHCCYMQNTVSKHATIRSSFIPDIAGGRYAVKRAIGTSADPVLLVQASETGTDWTTIESVTVSNTEYETHFFQVPDNAPGYHFIRFYHEARPTRIDFDDIAIEGNFTVPEAELWMYEVHDGTATVTGADPAEGDLTIPPELGGFPVTRIGEFAFAGCNGLTGVEIPDSVRGIGERAFAGCKGLASVAIPGSVAAIGENAFAGCTGLVSVLVPQCVCSDGMAAIFPDAWRSIVDVVIDNGVTNIGALAFADCLGMTSVSIPDSVAGIGEDAFYGCSDSIFDDASLPDVRLVDGWAVGTRTPYVPRGNLELVGVRGIADDAFSGHARLTSVSIGNGASAIGNGAFRDCTGLESVEIPASVANVGIGAFSGCTGLATLYVPASWKDADMLAEADVPDGCEVVYGTATGQTLSWAPLGTGFVPGERVALSATASGGGKVLFEVLSGPGVVEGDVLTFTGAGTVAVRASQPGDVHWLPVDEMRDVSVAAHSEGRRVYADLVANYPDSWTDGSNGGDGFKVWKIREQTGSASGWSGCGIWNPSANNAFTGTWAGKSKAFGLVGKGIGYSVTASRSFLRPLCIGDSFALEMAVNQGDETKGFVLTARGRDIITVDHASSGNISVNGNTNYAILNMPGLHPMTWMFTVVNGTTLRFTSTGRDDPANVCTGTIKVVTSAIDGFRLQSIGQYYGAGDREQTYYDNFRLFLQKAAPVEVPVAWLEENAPAILAANRKDYGLAALATASNGVNTVWECYVAGLEPEEKGEEFKVVTSFENGEWKIAPDPDLNKGGTETNRLYTWEGAEVLDDETVWGPTNAASRFFRVKVALPEE
jgi:hypothetical protein